MKGLLRTGMALLLLLCSSLVMAQQIEVNGTITTAGDGSVLPGVNVSVKGTTIGTLTNENGQYNLRINPENAVLVFSYIGYEKQEVAVSSRTTINVALKTDDKTLNEVVVTALGISRDKKALGYATQSVNAEQIVQNRQPNVVNALQGKVAGVTISSTGGAPGQGARILIRGINSIDATRDNQPLFVVDGVLFDNSTSTGTANSGAEFRGASNRGADINPDDVETINILKGGAATALYGLRGANGVVVITTKSGKTGALRATYSGTYGFENVNKYPEVQDKYTIGYAGIYNPQDFFPSWGPTVADAIKIDPTHPQKLYNHFKDAFYTGRQFQNNLSFSGGNEKITFLSSIGHVTQEGVIPFTNYNKLSVRLNTNVKFSDKFSTNATLNFINSGGDRYNADRYNESLSYWSPRYDVRDYLNADGSYKTYGNGNPIYGAMTNKFRDNVNRLVGGLNFIYSPLSWLTLNYRAGLDTYSEGRLRTAPGPSGIADERILEDNLLGFVYQYNTNFRAITSTFAASANTKFGNDLNATLRIGHDLYDRRIRGFGVEGRELAVYNYFDLRNAKTAVLTQNAEDYRLMGIFGELTLDYNDYLFLTLTGRNDITSSLRAPNNSFFYPSVSVGYVFSQQFNLPQFITMGKLRASYAQIGKDAAPYSTITGYSPYTQLPSGSTGFTRGSLLGDPNLRPEFTDTFESGVEMNFLKNRLGFDFTYYNSVSKDQIIQVDVTSSTGYVKAAINSGAMRNRGIELVLRGTPIRQGKLTWDVNLNFSANRNKILSIREGLTEINYASQFGYSSSTVTMKLVPGYAYGNLYGRSYKRYYADPAEETVELDKSRPIVIGTNGFPVINTSQKLIGNSQPKWIGGMTNTLRYGDFSLTALVDARVGQDRYNQLSNFFSAFGIAKYTEDRNDTKVFEGVLADGAPNTKAVWLGQGVGPDGVDYGNGFYRNVHRGVTENFIEDGSWVRLRSVGLSYNLPTSFLKKSFIKNASLSVTGNNLALWTKYTGYDPETSSTNSGSNVDGFTGFTYPAVRSFLFTINAGF
ncbi:SusC/RagA family TonB-linked outer membrane protein [Spirosoma utsteinense]|uniref:TonB-linked SusC/RagA family outer membrane protein n=1 Tax=Spirosoma utsteinense TaxID=2585773 RepID=A0ABR6W6B1_9BACT|nr:SusC/RagA family TonB-linked outer membrane protein [Spirosoma utsteinense]MBC3788276.1 TonB-linked SusC/RagA family outer membrane protein [Spirosoma utsteinense]MBC3792125.1 TonB-linked SusC/RagA family outer membrane protein [Spirosoma utsteinense]